MSDKLDITVTKMGSRWFGVLTVNGLVRDRMACSLKSDIGWICREMMRWYDKLGGNSPWAKSARRRQKGGPHGEVWYRLKLENQMERKRREGKS